MLWFLIYSPPLHKNCHAAPCRTLKFCFRCAIGDVASGFCHNNSFSQPGNDRAMESMEAIDHDYLRSKWKVIVRLLTQFLWHRSIIIGLESGNRRLPITFENPGSNNKQRRFQGWFKYHSGLKTTSGWTAPGGWWVGLLPVLIRLVLLIVIE